MRDPGSVTLPGLTTECADLTFGRQDWPIAAIRAVSCSQADPIMPDGARLISDFYFGMTSPSWTRRCMGAGQRKNYKAATAL
jgi:hypothetical protein